MDNSSDEAQCRSILQEVVALSALPSIWATYHPPQVAESLAEVLLNTLPLSFVCVRLRDTGNSDESEVIRTGRSHAFEGHTQAISRALAPWLDNGDATLQHTIPNPAGNGTVRLLRVPLGRNGNEGVVVAGSVEAVFPSENDRVLLSVGANQAGIVLQHWRAEKQLRETESLWKDAQRLANVGSWSWNTVSNMVHWSDELFRIFGLEPQTLPMTYDRILASIHADDRARVENRIAQAFRDYEPYECTFQILRPDGSIRVVKSLGQVVFDRDNKPVRMFGTVQDITEQCHAEQLIRDSEERFRAICDQAIVGIAQVDLAGRFLFANDRFLQSLGYASTELLQMQMQDIMHPEDLPATLVQFRALTEGGSDYMIEKRYVRKDGTVLLVRNHVNGIRDLSGKVTSRVAVSVDITEQKRQEEALRASEARYRIFVDHANSGMFLHDVHGRVVDVNRHVCETMGYSRDELIGKTPAAFDPDVTPEMIAQNMTRLIAGETIAFDARHRRKDGSTFPVEVRIRPFEVDGNFYALSLAHDITERTKTEEALRNYANQLRDLSRRAIDIQENERRHLARELHDEIGQILNAISVNLHALNVISDTASKPRLDESISIVDKAIHQVHNLSLDLRPSMLDELGLVSTIRWFAGRQAQRAGLELAFVADSSGERLPAALEIACYRIVQEALTNVVRHAQAQNVQVEFRQQEDEVQLVIRDDGIGFNVDTVQQKTATGASFGVLGMQERVDLLGGQIEFTSEPGHGTSLHVHFPLASQPTSNVESQARQQR
jgi:PAS domain S-box-containing protein